MLGGKGLTKALLINDVITWGGKGSRPKVDMFDMMTEITEILGKPLISNTPKIDDVIYEQPLTLLPIKVALFAGPPHWQS